MLQFQLGLIAPPDEGNKMDDLEPASKQIPVKFLVITNFELNSIEKTISELFFSNNCQH